MHIAFKNKFMVDRLFVRFVKNTSDSDETFRSFDLGVGNPTRFLCATTEPDINDHLIEKTKETCTVPT